MTIFFRCLDGIGKSGESSSEYLTLYKRLIQPAHWKYYLAIKGVMLHLGDLITKVTNYMVRVIVFNATFNNISVLSWQSVLLVEETRENH